MEATNKVEITNKIKRTQTETKKHRSNDLQVKHLLAMAAPMFVEQMFTTTKYPEFPQGNSSERRAQ